MADFSLLSGEEALAALGSDAQRGLSESDARARLAQHGRNELAHEEPDPPWKKLAAQFREPLVLLLLLAAALALGVDPAHASVMTKPPRPEAEKVITPKTWRGVLQVGVVVAAGTLLVLDAGLPGGFIEGTGTLRYAQTMAFTTLVFFSLFTVFNSRSDERSAFEGFFSNKWLWAAVILSFCLQVAVVYTPFLQSAFSTVPLDAKDWALCFAVSSSVLWIREITKRLP